MSISSSRGVSLRLLRRLLGALGRSLLGFALLLSQAREADALSTRLAELLGAGPDSAMITVAVPGLGRTERRAMKFVSHIATAAQPNAARDALVGGWTRSLGLEEATTIAGLLRGLGVDPDEPMAAYLDFTPLQARAQRAAEISREPMPWWHEESTDSAPDLSGRTWVRAALVVHCEDPVNVEQQLRRLSALAGAPGFTAVAAPGDTQLYENLLGAYSLNQGKLYVANDAGFLREVLEQTRSPRSVRYGSTECPELHADEIVMLTRLDKAWQLHPSTKASHLAGGKDLRRTAEMLDTAMMQPEGLFTSADPCVTTISVEEDSLSLSSRIHLPSHIAYAEYLGPASPARLHQRLPAGASGMVELHLSTEMKRAMTTGIAGWSSPGSTPTGDFATPMVESVDAVALGFYSRPDLDFDVCALVNTHDSTLFSVAIERAAPGRPVASPDAAPGTRFATLSRAEDAEAGVAYWEGGAALASSPQLLKQLARQSLSTTPPPASSPILDSSVSPEVGVIAVLRADGTALQRLPDFLATAGLPLEDSMASLLRETLSRVKSVHAGKVIERGWQRLFANLVLQ